LGFQRSERRASLAEPRIVPVHTAVPGRARFAVVGLYHSEALALALQGQLWRRRGIVSVSASALTGKVLILFDPGLHVAQVQAWVEGSGRRRSAWLARKESAPPLACHRSGSLSCARMRRP
jgi:hypothetical protein